MTTFYRKKLALSFLISLLLKINIVTSTTFQTMIYISYTPASDATNPDTHNIEMLFGSSLVPHPIDATITYKVSLQRNNSDSNTNIQYKSGNTRNRRYLYYLMGMNLLHPYGRSYVAYNITQTCNASNPQIALIVKYFNCLSDAGNFYDSIQTGNKILVSATAVVNQTTSPNNAADYLSGTVPCA